MSESPYSAQNPNLQLAWDSMSLGTLMECPRKYQIRFLQGFIPAKAKIELDFGIAFHSVMQFYHNLRAGKRPRPGLQITYEEELKKDIRQTIYFILKQAQSLAEDPKGFRTPFTLLRSFIWYADKWREDYLETYVMPDGKAATELSFRVALPLISPDGSPYLYCGHIDRGVHFEGEVLVTDHKTTAGQLNDHWLDPFKTSSQITGYIFGAGSVIPNAARKAVIDGVQLAIGFHRFKRAIVERTPAQMEEWLRDVLHYLRQAEQYAEDNYWPMNRASCGNYGGCPYLGTVCGMDPSVRQSMLEGDFIVQTWNPLESR